MKEKYHKPDIEIISFSIADVLSASLEPPTVPEFGDDDDDL